MRCLGRYPVTLLLMLTLPVAVFGQAVPPKPELTLFHPSGVLPSYEVATIKPRDPDISTGQAQLPASVILSMTGRRRYIMNAYGASYAAQVIGGPDWLGKEAYNFNGKMSEELKTAFDAMTRDARTNQTRMLQQSLLAERFHLKAHFETRILPVYEVVPARSGLKVVEVPGPPERKPGDPPVSFTDIAAAPPGSMMSRFNSNGLRVLDARAVKMDSLMHMLANDVGDRPIVDHTGFTGYFDIAGLTWAPMGDANAASQPDAPLLESALTQKLGVRLVPARAAVEVLVIDSIDRPTEN